MKPVLFEIWGWQAHAYAVFMFLGFASALGVILLTVPPRREGVTGGLGRGEAWDLFLVMVISALIGSKLGHVLFEAEGHVGSDGQRIGSVVELLRDDPWHALRIAEPGYVWYGGLLGCLLVAVAYFRRRPELDGWQFADAFAPAVMFGAAVGRVGCFFAGCCYGKPTDVFFGVQFPGLSEPVHPTQLYDVACALALGFVLLWRFGRRRFVGENIAILLMGYAFLRGLTEVFRGDAERGGWGPLSTSQWISIPVFLTGVGLYVRLRARAAPRVPVSKGDVGIDAPNPVP